MILNFGNQETEKLYITGKYRKFPQTITRVALRKLDFLNAAKEINDLRVPPGNRLEKLKGDFEGMYSIRINQQYRIIFSFENSNVSNVEIIDYH